MFYFISLFLPSRLVYVICDVTYGLIDVTEVFVIFILYPNLTVHTLG